MRAAPDAARVPQAAVGWTFITLYALAYMSTCLLLVAPALVTLALKINTLVGLEQAPRGLAEVSGIGALVSMVGNPLFGRMSDRTSSSWGMRRPWMVIGLAGGSLGIFVVAVAPSIPIVLIGWCVAQLLFNALLAAMVAVLPDQVPVAQRGQVSGVLGVCLPVAAVSGTFLVQWCARSPLAMFMVPCAVGGALILLFALTLDDRRRSADAVAWWTPREFLLTFYVAPRQHPDFAWAFLGRLMFVLAYAFLVTYQAYFLMQQIGTTEADVPHRIFLSTLVQSSLLVMASLGAGRLSDWTQRRKVFVVGGSLVYGAAMLVLAVANSFPGVLVGIAISGLGFGAYMAVDLALVAEVLPDADSVAKDLGVFNIAGALPFALAPAIAPTILLAGGGRYSVLYAVAGVCAVAGAMATLPIRSVR